MNMRASELGKFLHFHILSAISFNILLVLLILYLRNIYIFRGPFYQARVIIDSEINYNSDPLKIDINFRSIISLRLYEETYSWSKVKIDFN